MKKNIDVIVALVTLLFLGMAFSAYVFAKPVTTIIFIVGGVSLGVVILYGFLLSILERREERKDQPALTVLVQEQQENQTETQIWQDTDAVDETQEGLGMSAM